MYTFPSEILRCVGQIRCYFRSSMVNIYFLRLKGYVTVMYVKLCPYVLDCILVCEIPYYELAIPEHVCCFNPNFLGSAYLFLA